MLLNFQVKVFQLMVKHYYCKLDFKNKTLDILHIPNYNIDMVLLDTLI